MKEATLSHDRRKPEEDSEYRSFLSSLSKLDRLAVKVTTKVGSVGFFLVIFFWTLLWTGYNIAATIVHFLHWKAFDPFPAFVAYLLISNVIQILLMPLIMVGQNLEAKHTEQQSKRDFHVNQRAEKEIRIMEAEITHVVNLLETLLPSQGCALPKRVHHLKHEDDVDVRISED